MTEGVELRVFLKKMRDQTNFTFSVVHPNRTLLQGADGLLHWMGISVRQAVELSNPCQVRDLIVLQLISIGFEMFFHKSIFFIVGHVIGGFYVDFYFLKMRILS